ncbi:MAG: hypothetical protein ACOH1Y_14595 [Propionicimonas sp.]
MILQEARTAADPAAVVTALDALARLAAPADPEAARAHLDEADAIAYGSAVQEAVRVDAAAARALLTDGSR